MSVIPDVVPQLTAQVDLRLAFGQGSGYTDHEAGGGDVLAGVHVPVSAVSLLRGTPDLQGLLS